MRNNIAEVEISSCDEIHCRLHVLVLPLGTNANIDLSHKGRRKVELNRRGIKAGET